MTRHLLTALTLVLLCTVHLALALVPARAHQDYPYACCENKHCHPVACEEIHSFGDWWTYKGSRIEKIKAQSSEDGACHVCIAENGVFLCLFLGGQV